MKESVAVERAEEVDVFQGVFFSSALVSLSDADRERDTEGKCSASGDLKIYPPNLLSMDRAFASLQHI